MPMIRSNILISRSLAIAPLSIALMANAQTTDDTGLLEEIVVTGSRTTTSGNNAPTPVTVVATEDLLMTTPTTVAEAVMQLPAFAVSRNNMTQDNASHNATRATLNLRGFGHNRNLVLMDGRRVPPSAQDGTVDLNTLPQMFMQRVDIVTGGASAVYGSDAITGVVNFILDDNFNGFKVQASTGTSLQYGDADRHRVGIAAGSDFLDGRLQLQGSFETYSSAGIEYKEQRPIGAAVWCHTGNGSAANPNVQTENCRRPNGSYGGLITSGPMAGYEFASNGVLTPFVHGQTTASPSVESGGNGVYISGSSLLGTASTDQYFGLANYDFSNRVNGFVMMTLNKAKTQNHFGHYPAHHWPPTLSVENAFLTEEQRALVSAGGAETFTFGKNWSNEPEETNIGYTTTAMTTVGLEGVIGNNDQFNWTVYATHGNTELEQWLSHNVNNAKLYAAFDAVIHPDTGQVVCHASIAHPDLYGDCIPVNPFGPDTGAGLSYAREPTVFVMENKMNNFGFSIAGEIFAGWAGPVVGAFSAEYQDIGLTIDSDFDPVAPADCTGLRFDCGPNTVEWARAVVPGMDASQTISEAAIEATIPLIVDVPMAQSLSLNTAIREAKYSVSGNATTWKVGLDWQVTNSLRFRSTQSLDIRAPTLNDMFQPTSSVSGGYTDNHIICPDSNPSCNTGSTLRQTQGNPDLVPEEADTFTVGLVYESEILPGFSLALDYFKIEIENAIQTLLGDNTTNQQCADAGGTGPFCSLIVRPLPFSDRTPANYPIMRLGQPLNVAITETHGVDMELNYSLDLGSGQALVRLFGSYQPELKEQQWDGATVVDRAGVGDRPVSKLALMARYSEGPFTAALQTRWRDNVRKNAVETVIYEQPYIASHSTTDLNLSYDGFDLGGDSQYTVSLIVNNLFDKEPPVVPGGGNTPNFSTPALNGDDVIGRFFTLGFKMEL